MCDYPAASVPSCQCRYGTTGVESNTVCPNVGARQAGDRSPEGSAGSGSGQQETALKGCWQEGPGPCAHGHGEVPSHGPPAGNVSHPVSVT